MYRVYAIDPSKVCESWERFRFFWSACGYDKGRLIAKFPSKWQSILFDSEAFNALPEVRQSRVEVLVSENRGRVVPSGRKYDKNTEDWLHAAELAHAEKAFAAIVAEVNPRDHKGVYLFDDLDGDHHAWMVETSGSILRQAQVMADSAAPLLRASKKFRFIDPHFDFKGRFKRPLKKFLLPLVPYERRVESIEIHFKYKASDHESKSWNEYRPAFERILERELPSFIPASSTELAGKIEFVAWSDSEKARLHPRYILTDVGGLNYENGLDCSDEPDATTLVSFIGGDTLAECWKQYDEETSPFEYLGRVSCSK
jgi:hypothetical protein